LDFTVVPTVSETEDSTAIANLILRERWWPAARKNAGRLTAGTGGIRNRPELEAVPAG
jgi:hypothetical protein